MEKIIGVSFILLSIILLIMSDFSFLSIIIVFLNGLAFFTIRDYARISEYLRLIAIGLLLILFLKTILIF